MSKIFEKISNMPPDFWVLIFAIPVFSIACAFMLAAKKNRYKTYDKDGKLFEDIKDDAFVCSSIQRSFENDVHSDGMDGGDNSH